MWMVAGMKQAPPKQGTVVTVTVVGVRVGVGVGVGEELGFTVLVGLGVCVRLGVVVRVAVGVLVGVGVGVRAGVGPHEPDATADAAERSPEVLSAMLPTAAICADPASSEIVSDSPGGKEAPGKSADKVRSVKSNGCRASSVVERTSPPRRRRVRLTLAGLTLGLKKLMFDRKASSSRSPRIEPC